MGGLGGTRWGAGVEGESCCGVEALGAEDGATGLFYKEEGGEVDLDLFSYYVNTSMGVLILTNN